MNKEIKMYHGTHEQYKEQEPINMNYVTCRSFEDAKAYKYKFEEIDGNKEVDHFRVTKGIDGEDVYYVYYTYTEEES